MTDLIDDLFNYIPENHSVRDYKGYQQHRETYEIRVTKKGKISFRLQTRWTFLVIAFRETEGRNNNTCFVAKSDGGFEEVPIDYNNRITIAGKKYSRRHWNH